MQFVYVIVALYHYKVGYHTPPLDNGLLLSVNYTIKI